MPNFTRIVQLNDIIDKKSFFLIGPRQTGKSTLLRQSFPNAKYIDLLEADTYRELSAFPESIRMQLKEHEKIIIIDEVQKLPSILDEVQALMDRNKQLKFILTGSSARKLKRGKANLLGGRAWYRRFHPLVSPELGTTNVLDRINWGGLPGIVTSQTRKEDLDAYVGTYLREEIQAEGLTRSIENFSRFLSFAAHLNTLQLNYTKIGNDSQVPPRTVRDYFQILTDTLIAETLPSFTKTKKRKAVATEKFYFFDLGVARNLMRRGLIEDRSTEFGSALEHLIFLELTAYRDYRNSDLQLSYWRSQSKFEVDFLLNEDIAIEVKASARVSERDLRGLAALSEEISLKRQFVISSELKPRKIGAVEIIHYTDFLKMLWGGEIV